MTFLGDVRQVIEQVAQGFRGDTLAFADLLKENGCFLLPAHQNPTVCNRPEI
jgi:hypothetical protein